MIAFTTVWTEPLKHQLVASTDIADLTPWQSVHQTVAFKTEGVLIPKSPSAVFPYTLRYCDNMNLVLQRQCCEVHDFTGVGISLLGDRDSGKYT